MLLAIIVLKPKNSLVRIGGRVGAVCQNVNVCTHTPTLAFTLAPTANHASNISPAGIGSLGMGAN